METPDATDLSSLLDRLIHTRRLLEHQLLEAARSLSIDRSSKAGRRFAGLVEAGAMLDATLLLVAMSGRAVSNLVTTGEGWTCTIRSNAVTRAATRTFTSSHTDLPAAVLAALIFSFLNADESPAAKRLSPAKRTVCVP
ncbi:hypothetical protein [Mesorhizobium caraganae]|uniref:hypothetical protein n=1 Tax=Mesorhizobium caraganae TaxID=483206 RepID=UPI003ECFCE9D